jgi:hypothetical protein
VKLRGGRIVSVNRTKKNRPAARQLATRRCRVGGKRA